MMKIYVCNAISLSMLDGEVQSRTLDDPVYGSPRVARYCGDGSATAAREWLRESQELNAEIISAVGHADTAAVFSSLLGIDVPVNRVSIKLPGGRETGVVALIGQLNGARLAEGATTLPEGATVTWWCI